MSALYKTYTANKNSRKVTLYCLAGAIVVVGGIFAMRAFLNRTPTAQAVASQPPAIAPVPQVKGIPLPSASLQQTQQQQITASQQTVPAPTQAPTAQPESAKTPTSIPAAPAAPAPAAAAPAVAPAVSNVQLSPEAAKLVAEADDDLKTGGFIAARDKLSDAVRMLQNAPSQQAVAKAKLEQLSQMWLYGKDVIKGDTLCIAYTVKPGDSLEIIGRHFKVPYEFLMEINKISKPEALRVGQQLKVVNGPFHVILSRSTFTLDLYLQNTYVRSYKVGLGKEGMETPTGLWRASKNGKMIKPKWTDPKTGKTYEGDAPDYPLGSRWIALDGVDGSAKGRTGFAIHGTKDPQTIGTKSSQGCIRLFNGDVIEVYNMMTPGYSEVRVID